MKEQLSIEEYHVRQVISRGEVEGYDVEPGSLSGSSGRRSDLQFPVLSLTKRLTCGDETESYCSCLYPIEVPCTQPPYVHCVV